MGLLSALSSLALRIFRACGVPCCSLERGRDMAIPQQQYQQSKPFRNLMVGEGQMSTPITFFGPATFADQSHPQYNPSFHILGLAPGSVTGSEPDLRWNPCEPRKRMLKEQELFENSQISSVDFLQNRGNPQGSVSTGLALSLDDKRLVSSCDSPAFAVLDEVIDGELQRQEAEMDRLIKVQGERLRQTILENIQANQLHTLSSVEEKIHSKLREKEVEVEDINKKNTELEERMKQLMVEAGAWQHRAKWNENMIATLKFNLQQVLAQSRESKEGCGDSEVDDMASCCNGGGSAVDFHLLVCKENKELKDLMTCKVCRTNEVCMLLLPCRHLCLCKDCESKLSFCPLCQSSKFIGMEVYM